MFGFVGGVFGFVLGAGFALTGEFPRRRLPAGKMLEVSEGVRWVFDGGFTSGGDTFADCRLGRSGVCGWIASG